MTFFACPGSTVAQRSEPCAELIISVSFMPNKTRLFEAVLKTKPLQQDIELQKGSRETAGTIEVRISVLRRTSGTHALTDANQWYEVQDWYEQYNRKGGYNLLPPSYEVELREGLSVDFSKNRERARIRKSKAPRPGTMGCPSFLLSPQRCVGSAKQSCSTSLMLSYRSNS